MKLTAAIDGQRNGATVEIRLSPADGSDPTLPTLHFHVPPAGGRTPAVNFTVAVSDLIGGIHALGLPIVLQVPETAAPPPASAGGGSPGSAGAGRLQSL